MARLYHRLSNPNPGERPVDEDRGRQKLGLQSQPVPPINQLNLFETIAGGPGAHGRFDESARGPSPWTAARLRLGKIGGLVALAAPLAAAAIGYHGVTKPR